MDEIELFRRLSVALAIGLLIGLERGWQQRDESEGERTAGLRTFALGGLLGGVGGLLAHGYGDGGMIALAVLFAVYSGVIASYRFRENVAAKNYGATTAIAAMLAFALGAYAILGNLKVAGAAGAATAGLLALKEILHSWLKRISWPELRSALMLLAMTFILLPFLPHEPVDPFGVFKPFEIWLLTVLIAAISFAGYIAIKVAGDTYGVAIAGLAGGLASSTAVTVNMANIAKDHPEQANRLAAGVALASAVMLVRVIAIIAVINLSLVKLIVWPLSAACVVLVAGAGAMLWGWTNAEEQKNALTLRNPFEFRSVLTFAVLLTAISALTRLATYYAGDAGAYVLAAVSGLADVDAITLSMARPSGGASTPLVATTAILIAVAINTLSKAAMAWAIAGVELGWRLAAVSGLAIAVGAAGAAIPTMFVG